MALYRDPVERLLEIVNQENDVSLDISDYDFNNVTPATPEEGSTASYNTKVTITANHVAAPYAGAIDLYYNRLSFDDLDKMVDLNIRSTETDTSHAVIPSLNRRFGLSLKTTDIELVDAVDQGEYKTVVIQATPDSLGWIGSATLTVSLGDLPIEEYLVNTELPGIPYPTEDTTRPYAQFYSYWRDFTEQHDVLSTITTGDEISMELSTALDENTGDVWLASGTGEFSLGGATVVFAGITSERPGTNDDYDYVVEVTLDSVQCTGLSGTLVLHYNEPFDPMVV